MVNKKAGRHTTSSRRCSDTLDSSPVSHQEIEQLVGLLQRLRAAGLAAPKLPKPVWDALNGLVPQPALELVITRSGADFLLTERVDEHWNGWHIPGGFLGCGEAIEAACLRIARADLGIAVELERVVGAYTWPDHPYASAVSLICVCRARAPVSVGQFFVTPPDKMVPHHREFLHCFLDSQP